MTASLANWSGSPNARGAQDDEPHVFVRRVVINGVRRNDSPFDEGVSALCGSSFGTASRYVEPSGVPTAISSSELYNIRAGKAVYKLDEREEDTSSYNNSSNRQRPRSSGSKRLTPRSKARAQSAPPSKQRRPQTTFGTSVRFKDSPGVRSTTSMSHTRPQQQRRVRPGSAYNTTGSLYSRGESRASMMRPPSAAPSTTTSVRHTQSRARSRLSNQQFLNDIETATASVRINPDVRSSRKPQVPRLRPYGYTRPTDGPRLGLEPNQLSLEVRKPPSGETYGLESVILERLKRSMEEYNLTPHHCCLLDAIDQGYVPDEVLENAFGDEVTIDDLYDVYEREFPEQNIPNPAVYVDVRSASRAHGWRAQLESNRSPEQIHPCAFHHDTHKTHFQVGGGGKSHSEHTHTGTQRPPTTAPQELVDIMVANSRNASTRDGVRPSKLPIGHDATQQERHMPWAASPQPLESSERQRPKTVTFDVREPAKRGSKPTRLSQSLPKSKRSGSGKRPVTSGLVVRAR